MVPEIQVILPRTPSRDYLVNYVRVDYQIWRQAQELRRRQWKPQNIRFPHDPNWRNRLVSVQCIRDSLSGGPKSVSGVFWVGVVAPLFALGALSLALNIILLRNHR